MKKLASIIIPVYNVEPFLRKCLDSVINQTYENIEILIVDDGSTDQSGKICNDYSVDSRVTVFHQVNGGLSAARNTALNHANGEYLFFVDSDDFVSPTFVSDAVTVLEKEDSDIVIFNYTEAGMTNEEKNVYSKIANLTAYEIKQKIISDDIGNYVWNKAYRKFLFSKLRFPEGEWFEDLAVMGQLFMQAKKISMLNKSLYFYRIQNTSYLHKRTFNPSRDFLKIKRLYGRLPLALSLNDIKLYQNLQAKILDGAIELTYLNYFCEELDTNEIKFLEYLLHQQYEKTVLTQIGQKVRIMHWLILHIPSFAQLLGRSRYKRKCKD
ncbi:MAG: glycosyltransferase family 2 protein [Acidaminococcaceae bacterium]|nr:glycosyltransferase family 2 protein [Acidaminococcaceae bacterium]